MSNFENININLIELEKDYGEGILKGYIKEKKNNYISNKYKRFMKTIKGIEKYKLDVINKVGRYGAFLILIVEFCREDNSLEIQFFKEATVLSDRSFNRLIKVFKEGGVLKKIGPTFYLNPLIAFSGKDINPKTGKIFEDELNKIGITVY